MILLSSRKGQAFVILVAPLLVSYVQGLIMGVVNLIMDYNGMCLDTSLLLPVPTWGEAGVYAGILLGLFAAGNSAEWAANAYRDRGTISVNTTVTSRASESDDEEYESAKPD